MTDALCARAPGHGYALWRVVARVTSRAQNCDQLAIAGVVVHMRRIQVLVTRSAAGASVVGYFQKRKPVPAPVRAVVFAECWPNRHPLKIVNGVAVVKRQRNSGPKVYA